MTQTPSDRADARPAAQPATRSRLAGTAGVLAVFVLLALLIATNGAPNDRIAADQDLFHLPVIRQFAAQWPRPDLRDYASATAPGYHLLLAAVSHYASDDVRTLRIVGAAFGVAFVGLLAWGASRRSAWLALPAAASVYVLGSTVWLLPENAAWVLVTLAMLLALRADGIVLFAGSAVTLAALVFVRQTHVWAFAPAAYSIWQSSRQKADCSFSSCQLQPSGAGSAASLATRECDGNASQATPLTMPSDNPSLRAISTPDIDSRQASRISGLRLLVVISIVVLPATLVLLALVRLWHGLTPPAFQPGSAATLPLATRAGGLAPGAPAMTLALLGGFGTPLLVWFWPAGERKKIVRIAATGAAIGLLAGLLPPSEYDVNHRSGLWNLVRLLPIVAHRSPPFVGLSALGGATTAVVLARLHGRPRLVLAIALLGFAAVQTTNASLWQRYYEPFVLLWLALAASEVTDAPAAGRCWRVTGLAVLVAVQLAASVYTLGRGG